jgi:glucose-6-phosphate-specific signal transduction histidine kinase
MIRFVLAYSLMWAGVVLSGTLGALALVAAAGLLLSLARGGD